MPKRGRPKKLKNIQEITPPNIHLETIPELPALKVSPEVIPPIINYKCDVTRCNSQAEVFANNSKYCKSCAKDRGL